MQEGRAFSLPHLIDEGKMQGDWALPNWFLEGLPGFFLPPGGRQEFTTLSNNHFQDIQFFNLVNTCRHDHLPKPRSRDFGGAWKAALQSALAVVPWQHCNEKERTFDKGIRHRMNSHCTSHHAGVQRSLQLSSHLSNLYSFLEHFFMEANSLCFPAALAWSNAIMPPLENLHSKLLPTHLDKARDDTLEKEGVLEETVEAVDISQIPIHKFSEKDNVVIEPKTGFQFPVELYPGPFSVQSVATGKQVLAGVGLRGLTIMKLKSIKIYAFGLYIRPDVLKAQLSDKYGAASSEELKHNPRFFADLLSHDLGMTLRLMVHYKALKMGMVKSAFDTSLRNRLKRLKGTDDDEGLEAFNSYFSQNLLLPRGTIIDFRWLPGGQLRTEIDGQLLGTIRSRDFCRAFFDIYIGDPPVSSKAKEEIGEKLSQILQTS